MREGCDAGTAGTVRLRLIGDPILRTPARAVARFDANLRHLVRTMRSVMVAHHGAGLAANQIGVDLAVFVLDCDGVSGVVVNPVVEELSDETLVEMEGCLSIPGRSYPTPRAASTTVSGCDENGDPMVLSGHGWLARCLQHETDHLQGRVYLDRLPGRQRQQAWADLEVPTGADTGSKSFGQFRR
jgi:peptide deformylase